LNVKLYTNFVTYNYTVYYTVYIFMKLIHQLAKESGIPIGTIRFYEKTGLISGSKKDGVTTNNYVYYGNDALEKLQFIQMAKSVGFTLAEIKEVIDAWYRKEMSRAAKLKVLDLKIIQINEKVKELQAMKKHIEVCKMNISKERE